MKIRIMSDLHLEFADMIVPGHPDDQHTVLVLAGDTGLVHSSNIKTRFIPFLKRCAEQFRHVVMIVGNHEHYGGSFRRTHDKLRDALKAAKLQRVTLLEKETFVIDDVAFIGATMWTSCDKFSPYASFYWNGMTDYKVIRTGPNKTLPYDRRFRAEDSWEDWRLAKQYILSAITEQKEAGNKVVVVTHHAPTPMSIHPMYAGDTMNMFYHSDMVLDIMDTNPDLWFHGHVHTAFDYLIDSTMQICQTRVICNPRGYIGEESTPISRGFDEQKYVEL